MFQWLGLALGSFQLTGCIGPPVTPEGRVYHCVGTARPVASSGTWAKPLPLERFEYGDRVVTDRPTVGSGSYCAILLVPQTAYIRYRVDGRVIEKRFDLSALTPIRVAKKTIEFYVDGDSVEVRLVTTVPGDWPVRETVVKQ
ncbi:hypothetical protein ACQ86G_18905 [Roseateles chitinivorans]|uniref:hypothetical protein n=1 Tax=Roseateles chitinivorans TaxID=2917965 RepID=UPI003D66CA49